jgi:phage baseplate assembly protein W
MMALAFPFQPDARGRSGEVFAEAHIEDMIEQVLFTVPGERVNRPDFGCGLLQLVFSPNNEAVAAALELTIQSALQQWLGDLIEIQAVAMRAEDARMELTVRYAVRRGGEPKSATFSRGLG